MNFEALDQKYLPGFERKMIDAGNGQILTLIGGSGPPVLMLHGDPQTHLCWHQVAPELSKHFTVILTDLPGRGESRKPEVSSDHESYWKKSMALDYPDSIIRLSILDIVPTVDFYSMTNAAIAQDYFYFYFLTQPASYPENLILGNPKMFMKNMLLGLSLDRGSLTIHVICCHSEVLLILHINAVRKRSNK